VTVVFRGIGMKIHSVLKYLQVGVYFYWGEGV